MTAAKRSPLLEVHRRAGARLVDFAGWEMPLQFTGVVAEHRAVRTGVGVFDVSHLGKLTVEGAAAGDALQEALTADVIALEPGRATYSLVLDDDAGCVDDVFVYRLAAGRWLVVPNAANVDAVAARIERSGARPRDDWDRWAIIAVQGPHSLELFERAWPGAGVVELKLHRFTTIDVFGAPAVVARTGYTGERGVELYAPAERAPEAWDRLVGLGAVPAGLGARDTLRLEMGYALYGHELRSDVNPLEAGLGWAVAWETQFRGRAALERIRAAGPARRLVGIRCTTPGVPRAHYPVAAGGDVIGELTSGNFSPTLGVGIGLALVAAPPPEPGAVVDVRARGRSLQAVIVKPPFVTGGGRGGQATDDE